ILIVSILLIAFTAFLPKGSPVLKNSLLSPHVTLVSENMAKIVSKDMKNQFEEKRRVLKQAWKNS
ncbi:MAG: CvpA family protein, partial [Deltaproteobacteria bacterium]|nr:CvpA family protein [Deltaproteobacteria bacterium]